MIDMRSRTVLAVGAAGVVIVAWILGPSTRENRAKADAERPPAMQAAVAGWKAGDKQMIVQGLRVSKGKKRIVNIGYVASVPTCKPERCISAAAAKKIPLGNFIIDPSLNSAELRLAAWGRRFDLKWEGTGDPKARAGESGTRVKRRGRVEGAVIDGSRPVPVRARGELRQVARPATGPGEEPSREAAPHQVAASADLPLGSSSSSCWDVKPAEKRMKRLIVTERKRRDLSGLRLDPELSKVARVHTSDMIGSGGLFHQPAEQLATRVTRWLKLGENVGAGASIASLHDAFMGSKTHRANILKPAFRHVGVGVSHHEGEKWITVVFESRRDPGTTLAMPSC